MFGWALIIPLLILPRMLESYTMAFLTFYRVSLHSKVLNILFNRASQLVAFKDVVLIPRISHRYVFRAILNIHVGATLGI